MINLPTKYSSEIDRRLTMQCDMSFLWSDHVAEVTKKLEIAAPGFMYFEGKNVIMYYYFPPSVENSTDGKRALTLMRARKRNDIWTVQSEVTDQFVTGMIESIIVVPSVVIDMIILDRGSLKVRFRFHPDFTEKLSDIILSAIGKNEGFSVSYFGKSFGMWNTLLEISSHIHLSAIRFNMKPDMKLFNRTNEIFGLPWIRIRKFDSGDLKMQHIYYMQGEEINESEKYGLITISKIEGLYEASSTNPVINFLVSECERLNLFSDSIHRFDGKILHGRIWIPTAFVPDYVNIMANARTKFPDWDLAISSVSTIEDIVKPASGGVSL